MTELTRISVTMDGIVDGLQAYHDETVRWNGAICPFFDRASSDALCKAMNEKGGVDMRYDPSTDSYALHDALYGTDEMYEGEDMDTVDGTKRLYPIGAWEWIWTESEV